MGCPYGWKSSLEPLEREYELISSEPSLEPRILTFQPSVLVVADHPKLMSQYIQLFHIFSYDEISFLVVV